MKYITREIEDPKGYIFLEISFEVDLYLVNRKDEDVKFDLTPEEKQTILKWFMDENENTIQMYSLSDYTIEFMEGSNNRLKMSYVIENPSIHLKSMTITHIIYYLSENMGSRRNYINMRNIEIFPKGICNFD
jgi:hypothetical protein